MAERAIDSLLERLPDDARAWIGHLSPSARTEIDRLLKETGVENFSDHWREHKAYLEELENSFATKL
ncbi:hypothetical protein ACFX5Q_15150 [Mesorhizobium sp. IMUNJ 23033]|uniref:hypothetical protein n=1 Tax=Mesorhizobium sp. IMUNJ 23033 TaxID=3378039 RepID=UPI00384CE947